MGVVRVAAVGACVDAMNTGCLLALGDEFAGPGRQTTAHRTGGRARCSAVQCSAVVPKRSLPASKQRRMGFDGYARTPTGRVIWRATGSNELTNQPDVTGRTNSGNRRAGKAGTEKFEPSCYTGTLVH